MDKKGVIDFVSRAFVPHGDDIYAFAPLIKKEQANQVFLDIQAYYQGMRFRHIITTLHVYPTCF
jgi:hypothetical protein